MCFSSPSYPSVDTTASTTKVASPTYADASTSKTAVNTRNKAAALAGRDVRTSARGLSDAANNKKKELLGQ